MLSTYTFNYLGRRHVLVTSWEAGRRGSNLEGCVRVSAFMSRVILREALREEPTRFKSYVIGSRPGGAGLDFADSGSAWEAYVDEELVNEWMPSHLLFEQPWARVSVNVPVVQPVNVVAPTPTDWIEIAFVDPAGEPVPNVSWTVEFSDSRVMRGSTGNNGIFRNANAAPGNARLTYRPNGLPSLQQMAPPGIHTVRPGQDIVSIAWAYGHTDSNVVWDHAQNQNARDAHESPMELLPGTRLFIPAVDETPASYATGQRHEVVIEPPTQTLALVIKGAYDDELSGARYVLEVGSTRHEGTVASSVVEFTVPLGTTTGNLSIWLDDSSVDPDGEEASASEESTEQDDEAEDQEPPPDFEATVLLSQLRPASELRGIQGRLRNLGLYGGAIDEVLGNYTHAALTLLAGERHTGDAVSDNARRTLQEAHE